MMSEQQTVVMYYYFDKQGNKVWTSNETLALMRAREYDSEVFRVEQPIIEKK
jgi:hypothetical protein